ncbi:hypothetical protein [Rhabdochromatium marinum]|uniref:hypothetical protein n=1 Tax=Rhabdochromatium marinum TaxID=48729 RepID=UPI00190808EA|nr:hypothetical protein [Rhabdochromatium marinum]MBK1647600.1 hypothetical protein [Rhabdochromatium marinum]
MKVMIRVDRVAAILAGRDCYGDLIAEVDPRGLNLDERNALACAPEQQGVTDLTAPFKTPGNYPTPPETATPDIRAWLRWRIKCAHIHEQALIEQQAEWKAQADAYIAYWTQQPTERFIRKDWPAIYYSAALPSGDTESPALPAREATEEIERIEQALNDKLKQARQLAEQRNRDMEKQKAEIAARRHASQQRRARQLSAWVKDNMDDNAKARFKLNLLPEDEILDAIRAATYQSLDGFERYRKIRFNDIKHGHLCIDGQSLDCDTDDAHHLSAEQFERFRAIEAAAPDNAKLKALIHSCACETCNAGIIRRSVQVVIPVGELLFSREYALDVLSEPPSEATPPSSNSDQREHSERPESPESESPPTLDLDSDEGPTETSGSSST